MMKLKYNNVNFLLSYGLNNYNYYLGIKTISALQGKTRL